MLNNLSLMRLRLLEKEHFRKQQKKLVISLVIKLLIELQKFQQMYSKIIQRLTNGHNEGIPKERYLSPEEIIDELRLI